MAWLLIFLLCVFFYFFILVADAPLQIGKCVWWKLRLFVFFGHLLIQSYRLRFLVHKFNSMLDRCRWLCLMSELYSSFLRAFQWFLWVPGIFNGARGLDASEGGIATIIGIYLDILILFMADLLVFVGGMHLNYFYFIRILKLSKPSTKVIEQQFDWLLIKLKLGD